METTAILAWSRWHSILITLAATGFLSGKLPAEIFALFVAGSFLALAWISRATLGTLRPLGGYANWVGALRLLLLLIGIAGEPHLSRVTCNWILTVMISLDALDGWLARRLQQETRFGQYLDMELDACFVLYACILLFQREATGAWILIPGFLRYAYVMVAWLTSPHEKGVDRKIPLARAIACLFFVLLTLSLFVQHPVQYALLVAASIGIAYSFALSFMHLRAP